MLNVVAIIGRLAASPELKTTNSGKSVCSFRIANDSGYKDASGQNQTNWLDVTAWARPQNLSASISLKAPLLPLMALADAPVSGQERSEPHSR